MPIYKGIEIDESLAGIIRFMQSVEDYREELGKLQGAWDILTLLGQLTGAAADMSGTREAFQKLTGELLNHLGREIQHKAVTDLRAKTQIGIDILVRNLFERTADIGFLSADDDIREFLMDPEAGREALQKRFRQYVDKYSVYADIVLFDAADQIQARLVEHPAERSQHPVLQQARVTAKSYVEYFGEADFLPAGQQLIYAFRVESSQGVFLGTLALVFRLDNEMAGVFANLLGEHSSSLLATISADGRVVASSSPIQLPAGTQLSPSLMQAKGGLIRFAGREYLAVACPAHGYQGYPGPGWLGLGLVPVEFAFESDDVSLLGHIDPLALAEVKRHPGLFSEALRQIPQQAERIQEDLNRSVWNGSVRQVDSTQGNAAFAKTLLWEISNTGRKTQAVFEQSIGNLHQTVVAELLQSCLSRAAFAIDVMDRNLYERANDCRWWALNATFRRVLAAGNVGAQDAAGCAETLSYINGLYTVYDNLILFDAQGMVIASSRPDASALPGSRLHEEWAGRCLALGSAQGYVVSNFAGSALYGGRATYIYAAAVRHPDDSRVIGGIGVVFDGEPQFRAMLGDALPLDSAGQPVAGAFALFVQRDGQIVATSDRRFGIGQHFPLTAMQLALAQGEQSSSLLAFEGEYYALGSAMSAGYREYKTSDGYVEDLLALCAVPLGAITGDQAEPPRKAGVGSSTGGARRAGNGSDTLEIASFYVGQQWIGMPAGDVVEAIDANGITSTLGNNNDLLAGVKMYRGQLISVVNLHRLMSRLDSVERTRQIVVIRTRNKICLGLLVDALGEIPEVARTEIQPMGNIGAGPDALIIGVVNGLGPEDDRHRMLSVLATERLCQRLVCQCPPDQALLLRDNLLKA